jgi:hypothetical protein
VEILPRPNRRLDDRAQPARQAATPAPETLTRIATGAPLRVLG